MLCSAAMRTHQEPLVLVAFEAAVGHKHHTIVQVKKALLAKQGQVTEVLLWHMLAIPSRVSNHSYRQHKGGHLTVPKCASAIRQCQPYAAPCAPGMSSQACPPMSTGRSGMSASA